VGCDIDVSEEHVAQSAGSETTKISANHHFRTAPYPPNKIDTTYKYPQILKLVVETLKPPEDIKTSSTAIPLYSCSAHFLILNFKFYILQELYIFT
jgi:hypothetical protein